MTDTRLDRLKDHFGEELARAARQPRRRVLLSRRTLAFAAAASAVAVVVALLSWPGGGGGSGLDVIAEARAALTPSDDEIVHLVIATSFVTPDGPQEPQTSEQWSAINPARWRLINTAASFREVRPGQPLDPDAQSFTDRLQQSYRPGDFRSFMPHGNDMSVLLGPGADERSRVPSALGLGDGDPVTELARMLGSGQLRDTGTVQSEGRTVRRLAGTLTGVHADGTPRRVVFDVDPDTFAPLAGSASVTLGSAGRTTTRFRVKRYERLPLDDKTAELLRIPTNPDTTVVAERGGANLIEQGTCARQPGSGDVVCRQPPR